MLRRNKAIFEWGTSCFTRLQTSEINTTKGVRSREPIKEKPTCKLTCKKVMLKTALIPCLSQYCYKPNPTSAE